MPGYMAVLKEIDREKGRSFMNKKDTSVSDAVHKRILIDLFVTPWSLFPFIGGASLLMIAWATKVFGVFAFLGFTGMVFGVGFAMTNLIWNYGDLSTRAAKEIQEQTVKNRENKLNELARRLKHSRELRDDKCLETLRNMYNYFLDDINDGSIEATPEVINQVEKIFTECIAAIEQSIELYVTARSMPKGKKKELLKKRDSLLEDVEKSTSFVADLMVRLRTSGTEEKQFRMSQLRENLQMHMEAASRTNERMIALEHGDVKDYSEYLDE